MGVDGVSGVEWTGRLLQNGGKVRYGVACQFAFVARVCDTTGLCLHINACV